MATRKIWKTVAEPTMAERTFTSEKLAQAYLNKLAERIEAGLVTTVQSVSVFVSADKGATWTLHKSVDLRVAVSA